MLACTPLWLAYAIQPLLLLESGAPSIRTHACQTRFRGWSIGISSGGVAEIFEANNPTDEVILMKERKGFIKLALKTGVPVAPCYIFGNTKLMSCWYDSAGWLQALSRKLKAGFLPIWCVRFCGADKTPACVAAPAPDATTSLSIHPSLNTNTTHTTHKGPVGTACLLPPAHLGRGGQADPCPEGGGGAVAGDDR